MNKKVLSCSFISLGYPIGIIDGKFQICLNNKICYLSRESYQIWVACRSNTNCYNILKTFGSLGERRIFEILTYLVKNNVLLVADNLDKHRLQKSIVPVRQGVGIGENSEKKFIILHGVNKVPISTDAYTVWILSNGKNNLYKLILQLKKFSGSNAVNLQDVYSAISELSSQNLLFLLR